jgi:hypothetical protein
MRGFIEEEQVVQNPYGALKMNLTELRNPVREKQPVMTKFQALPTGNYRGS